jgi:transposase InsO family protein
MGIRRMSYRMPWKETCPMDQRVAFMADWLRDEWTMTELATRYGISRKTAYKWVDRYTEDRETGLLERSRAPKVHGRARSDALRARVLALRRQYPHWGPKKLRAVLQDRAAAESWPAASTMGDWLRTAGLSARRRRTRYVVPLSTPLAAAAAPNDVWTADFKGWFRTGDGTRCDPLTVADACSRFVLCCRITEQSQRGVRPWFERVFREYGVPRALRTDNGAPFASTGPGRLTQLAVWWLKLGIQLDRIDPENPEQNGRHERFHLTLHQETTAPPAPTPRAQQQRFDRLRQEFNVVRPHEALGQRPPARVYVASSRPYPAKVDDPWYDATHQVRRVSQNGRIKWQGEVVFISEAMRREVVGLTETEGGDWLVWFMHVELGRIDRRTRRFTPAWHGGRVG